MKAKELKGSKYFRHEVDGEVLSEGYLFTEEEMAIFWSQLCKEQRSICTKEYLMDVSKGGTKTTNKIQHAPEPEFD